MKKIWIIAKKELQNYVTSPVGYVFAVLLLVVANWVFLSDFFILAQADLKPYWNTLSFLLTIFIPAISMGLLADEKKNSTWEVLLSLPIDEKTLVLGKFLGCGLYLTGVVLMTLPMVLMTYFLGKPDIGVLIGGVVGAWVLSLTYLSIGLFMSSLSGQAMVGFLGTTVFLILNNLIGQETILSRVPTEIRGVIESTSLSAKVANIGSGLINLNDVLFLISTIAIFIILTVVSLKTRDK